MKVGSLFTGVGGFDLGLEYAGMEIEWQVEYDKQCQQVLRRHWPGSPLYGDVREVGASGSVQLAVGEQHAEPAEGEDGHVACGPSTRSATTKENDERRTTRTNELTSVSLICGGFPCQDLSVAGKRAGLDGERSGLWHEFRRIIDEVTPRWVLIENVPGLLSSNGGRDMGVVLRGLEELGYGWAYRVLDSQYFGVAQRRRRVFIVGYLGSSIPAFRALFPVGTSLPGDTAPSKETGQGVAGSPGESVEGESGDGVARAKPELSPTLAASDHKGARNDYQSPTGVRGMCWWDGGDTANTLTGNSDKQRMPDKGHLQAVVEETKVTDMHGNGDGETVNTLTGDHLNRPTDYTPVLHTAIPRRLTPMECERLQGFPDGWTAKGMEDREVVEMADTPRYKMMGNAVTVNVAYWIGLRIIEAEALAK